MVCMVTDSPFPPALTERYELQQPLGRGAMGVVYRALHRRLGRCVAIKLINAAAVDDATRKRFVREARMLSRVSHPGVVRLYDADTFGAVLFLAMEHLEGETVEDRLAQCGVVSPGEVCGILAGVLDALECVHGLGILHRDIKPSNIFLAERGPVLIDFGLARSADGTALTETGEVLGTPKYVAPELITGGESSPRSDVFGLGLTGIRMLTDVELHSCEGVRGNAVAQILTSLTSGSYLSAARRSLSAAGPLGRVLLTAIEKEPEARYGSAAVMRRALEKARPRGSVEKDGAGVHPSRELTERLPTDWHRPGEDPGHAIIAAPEGQPTGRQSSVAVRGAAVVLSALLGLLLWRASNESVPRTRGLHSACAPSQAAHHGSGWDRTPTQGPATAPQRLFNGWTDSMSSPSVEAMPARSLVPGLLREISHLHLAVPFNLRTTLEFRHTGPGEPLVDVGYFDGTRRTHRRPASRAGEARWCCELPAVQVDALHRFRIIVGERATPWQYFRAPPMPFPRPASTPGPVAEQSVCERFLDSHLKADRPAEPDWEPGPVVLVASRGVPAAPLAILGSVRSPLVGHLVGLVGTDPTEPVCTLARASVPEARLVLPAFVAIRTCQTPVTQLGGIDVTIRLDYFSDPGEARDFAKRLDARLDRARRDRATAAALLAGWPKDPCYHIASSPADVPTHVQASLWYAGSDHSLWMPLGPRW